MSIYEQNTLIDMETTNHKELKETVKVMSSELKSVDEIESVHFTWMKNPDFTEENLEHRFLFEEIAVTPTNETSLDEALDMTDEYIEQYGLDEQLAPEISTVTYVTGEEEQAILVS